MPKVSESHRESRREQILDAAMRSFRARGFRATTMSEVIAESGLSAGAIYGYFSGKQELAVAVARRAIATGLGNADRAGNGEPHGPAELVGSIAAEFGRSGIDSGLIVQLWGEAASDPEFRSIAVALFRELEATLLAYLSDWACRARGMSDENAHVWAVSQAPIVLSLGQGMILQRTLNRDFDLGSFLAAIDGLFPVTSG